MKTWRMAGIMCVVLLALVCTSARKAEAQGTFYVEVPKDGRIYVFNNMKVYTDFMASGELGVSITRVGAGPNGETLVFDTMEAVHLYNFKHDLQAEVFEVKEEKKPTQKFSWKDGKTTFESEKAALILSNRIQFRYTYVDPEEGDGTGSFRVRRAKTKLEGWFYNKHLTYELQLNWADVSNALEDANLNYDITRGPKMFMVKIGQYKVPFGRQELTSSGSQQFVDRSIVSGEFARGRDIGVQLWGLPMSGKIDWRIGVFNGAGRNRTSNDNDEYQFDARLTWQPWGDVKYSESDFESSDKPLFAVAGQFERNTTTDAAGIDTDRDIWGADAAFKYKGLFAFTEYFDRTADPAIGMEVDSNGWHSQIGYFIVPKKFEAAFRYAVIDPSDAIFDNDRTETGVTFNYFWNKHNLKWQTDYRRLKDDATDAETNEFRSQVQFIF